MARVDNSLPETISVLCVAWYRSFGRGCLWPTTCAGPVVRSRTARTRRAYADDGTGTGSLLWKRLTYQREYEDFGKVTGWPKFACWAAGCWNGSEPRPLASCSNAGAGRDLAKQGRQDLDRHSPPILGEDSRPLPQIGPPATDGRRLETACPYFVPVLFFAVVENSGNHIIIWGGVIRSSCVAERRITRTCAFCSGLWLEAGKLLSQVPQDQPSRL